MQNYKKDDHEHVVRKEGEPFYGSIGCCCECKFHHPVQSHPWVNEKPMSDICAYVCILPTEELSDRQEDSVVTIKHKCGIGCEMWESRDTVSKELHEVGLDKIEENRSKEMQESICNTASKILSNIELLDDEGWKDCQDELNGELDKLLKNHVKSLKDVNKEIFG